MNAWEFIKKYYIDSIVYKQGYNIVNTLTWAVILVVAAVLLYKFLEKRIKIDEKFAYANIPFVILGSSVRVVEDAGFLKPPISYIFMTPFIYILIFLIAFPTLIITLKVFRDRYYKTYSVVGLVPALGVLALLLSNLEVKNGWVFPLGIAAALAMLPIYYAVSSFEKKMRNVLSITVFFSHMLDGFESYIGINFLGYWELHVLPRYLINTFGPVSLVLTKFFVFLGIIYIIDVFEEREDLKNFTKFVLIVLGLAPAIRNGLRMTFGV